MCELKMYTAVQVCLQELDRLVLTVPVGLCRISVAGAECEAVYDSDPAQAFAFASSRRRQQAGVSLPDLSLASGAVIGGGLGGHLSLLGATDYDTDLELMSSHSGTADPDDPLSHSRRRKHSVGHSTSAPQIPPPLCLPTLRPVARLFMLLTVILIISSFPSPTHSFIPKPSFSANPFHTAAAFSFLL